MTTTLLLPGLAFKIELTGLEPGPAVEQPFASEIRLEPVIVERPFTQIVAHEDAILGVDGRYHVVADSLPGIIVSERGKKLLVERHAEVLSSSQARDEFAAVQRLFQVDAGKYLSNTRRSSDASPRQYFKMF